jgi:protein tyrosine phosphatase (PTP) superfamily phosphohydrolase (DUF442 family)
MDTAFAEEIPCYRRLSERLVTAGQPNLRQIAALAPAGFDVVINLLPEDSSAFLPEEVELVGALGMQYISIPVSWERPTLTVLKRFYAVLEKHRQHQLFIHCAENKRVSIFMALYRIHRLGWQPVRALRDVERIWQPDETWQRFFRRALNHAPLAAR